ncbi:hypothetical protein TTRE_0000699301 [Trichuris trichiura]|uniref:Integrase catalytic domain-containing protein n=1 Tax=Trichuris trichiura TaxID=36087 RepID=A0A077ZFT8_TRITR|nr:hypothetical protein TTRE_0000699301 [Trichuris trichiura]
MAPENRMKVEKIKNILLAAFAADPFVAYGQLTSRRLRPGEAPDVFLADLRRLGSLAGGMSESVLGCAFVTGLPEHAQDMLRAGVRMADLTLEQLLERARSLMRWVDDGLSGRTRLRTKAANEMLIRRRVEIILALAKEYKLNLVVTLVKSADNKADALTRVPHQWLAPADSLRALDCAAAAAPQNDGLIAKIHHAAGHPGVRRTLYFAKRYDPTLTKRAVSRVVSECNICQSIDPAPAKWHRGTLDVKETWHRLSSDVTHYKGRPYLTVVDCGPSRFAIWRPLKWHTSASIVDHFEAIFLERGAPVEILVDNDPIFQNQAVEVNGTPRHVRHLRRCAPHASQRIKPLNEDAEEEELLICVPTRDVATRINDPAPRRAAELCQRERSRSPQSTEHDRVEVRRSSRLRRQQHCSLCD